MKYSFLLIILGLTVQSSFAQADSVDAPYKKFRAFPPVRLLLPDSSSFYTKDDLPKKKRVLLMLFNPTCEHCQHETEAIIRHIDELDGVQIVMATSMPFDSMMRFREKYNLAQYPNIIISQDVHYFLISYFMIHNLPFLAFYDKKKELISVFEGSMPIEKLLEEIRK